MLTPRSVFRILSFLLVATATVLGGQCPMLAGDPAGEMIEFNLRGRNVEGTVICWDDREVHLLGRDGRLWAFNPAEARDFKKASAHFRGYSPSELRAELLRELGDGYEVSGTSHYLVAHPRNQRDKWAQRFEDLYRAFVHYFGVRGFKPSTPPFPLVGVVCGNRADFARHATARGNAAPSGVQGYYDVESNRIALYDMGGKADSADWQKNAAVLIHEATHQTAFNTGIHSRYCPPPTWVVEGLAMLFEAPGIYDPRNNTRPGDRVNQDRLKVFRQWVAPRHRPEMLVSIVASDDLFHVAPAAAYAEAWALSFFLSETEPRKYAKYLRRTAARPPFQEYTSAERTADFTAVFGLNWRMLDARFLRFIGGLK